MQKTKVSVNKQYNPTILCIPRFNRWYTSTHHSRFDSFTDCICIQEPLRMKELHQWIAASVQIGLIRTISSVPQIPWSEELGQSVFHLQCAFNKDRQSFKHSVVLHAFDIIYSQTNLKNSYHIFTIAAVNVTWTRFFVGSFWWKPSAFKWRLPHSYTTLFDQITIIKSWKSHISDKRQKLPVRIKFTFFYEAYSDYHFLNRPFVHCYL